MGANSEVAMAGSSDRLFAVTGGPGSGKSTLIEALGQAGFAHSVEAGRGIIQDQVAIGGSAVPWGDRLAFAELMLAREMRSYHMAEDQPGPVFFDRGVPDVVGYLRLSGLPVARHMETAAKAFRYNRRVFIAPPWPEIFGQDSERKQTFDEAVRTYAALVTTYRDFGYALIEIPPCTVEERVRFVLGTIGGT
jgi:predicted ATPase